MNHSAANPTTEDTPVSERKWTGTLAVLKKLADRALLDGEGADVDLHMQACRLHDAMSSLLKSANKVADFATIMDSDVKLSKKNANAGFIDMRDWYAFQGDVSQLRDAISRVGGGS
jgi:hypothetical protein